MVTDNFHRLCIETCKEKEQHRSLDTFEIRTDLTRLATSLINKCFFFFFFFFFVFFLFFFFCFFFFLFFCLFCKLNFFFLERAPDFF